MNIPVPTINGLDARSARIHAELTNATNYTTATMTAFVLVSSTAHWLDKVKAITVKINLRAGYSHTDHLFDRLAQKVIALVDGQLFADIPHIVRAAYSAPRPECSYKVTWEDAAGHQDVPAEMEGAAESIREEILSKENAKKLVKTRKELVKLALDPKQRGDVWVIVSSTQPYADERYSYSLNIQPGNHFTALSYPGPTYATRADAAKAIEAYRAAINA